MSSYSCISNFGQGVNNSTNNPLTYCLLQTDDPKFLHGGIAGTVAGANNKNCQAFMSDYCAAGWDDICEFASQNQTKIYPNSLGKCGGSGQGIPCVTETAGDNLVKQSASKKYLTKMGGTCSLKYEPFDPTVASSPMVSFWEGQCNSEGNEGCVPVYEVDAKTIDSDPIMNKILAKPWIAWHLLVNIYNTALRKNTIDNLKGTKLYNFFGSPAFQKYVHQSSGSYSNSCSSGSCR